MKIAVTGKGGVGKTTLSALLVHALAKDDSEVLAVDCDPDSNLGYALGFKNIDRITPLVKMEKMIRERMGVSEDGTFFKLNPKIDDIPEKYSQQKDNVKLIVMGGMKKGGSGCACPENAFIKNLIEHLVLKRNEDVVMDMEAGVEHFGRGTAAGCDSVLVVVEPSQKSINSALRINELARDLTMKNVFVVANKVRTDSDKDFVTRALGNNLTLIESLPFSDDVLKMDKAGDISTISKQFSDKTKHIGTYLSQHIT
jgi:CO dehydrogenase maturation factor